MGTMAKPLEKNIICTFDVVALLDDFVENGSVLLHAGTQGTALELLPNGIVEVEFSDPLGNSLHIEHFHTEQLRRVWSYAAHTADVSNISVTK
jgi:hypothetical protein